MASTVFSLTSSRGASREVTTQSWQAISLMMQVSQSMIMNQRLARPTDMAGLEFEDGCDCIPRARRRRI